MSADAPVAMASVVVDTFARLLEGENLSVTTAVEQRMLQMRDSRPRICPNRTTQVCARRAVSSEAVFECGGDVRTAIVVKTVVS
jgi:hypothetical protein